MKTLILAIVLIVAAVGIWYWYSSCASCADVSKVRVIPVSEESVNKLPDGTYTADLDSSSLEWAAARIVGNSHHGTVAIKDGKMVIENGAVTSGSFTIDMRTITESNNNETFLKHINSDDFFSTASFPTATFVVKSITKRTDGAYDITGDLTIRNITNEITFPTAITSQNGGLEAKTQFTIDRTRWNINFDSGSVFTTLGDKAIEDKITFTLDLVLK